MQQSPAQLEREFQAAMERDRQRRTQLRKQAAHRRRTHRKVKVERGQRYRFGVLVVLLVATVVFVTVAMFEILSLLLG